MYWNQMAKKKSQLFIQTESQGNYVDVYVVKYKL